MRLLLLLLFLLSLPGYGNEPVNIRLQWKHQFEFAGFYAAKERGFYRDAGLEVTLEEYEEGVDIRREVAEGRAAFGTDYGSVIREIQNGAPLLIAANYLKRSPLALAVRPEILSPSDLRGRRVMASRLEMESATIREMLRSYDMEEGSFIFLPESLGVEAFARGRADAISIYLPNEPFTLRRRKIPFTILDPVHYGAPLLYDLNLITSKVLARQRPDLVQAFREATNRGWRYALDHPEELVELILEKYNTQGKSREQLLYEAGEIRKLMEPEAYPIGSVDPERIRQIQQTYRKLGDADKVLPPEALLFEPILAGPGKEPLLTVAVGYNKPPYVFGLRAVTGIEVETLRSVFRRMGLQTRFVQMGNTKLTTILDRNREIDVAACVPEGEYPGLVLSDPYVFFSNVAVTRAAEGLSIRSIADLKGKRSVTWADAYLSLGPEFYAMFRPEAAWRHSPGYREIQDQMEQSRLFFRKEAEVMVVDKNIFQWYREQLKKEIPQAGEPMRFHSIFPNRTSYRALFRDPELAARFNRELERFLQSDEYKELTGKYTSPAFASAYRSAGVLADIAAPYLMENRPDAFSPLAAAFLSPEGITEISLEDGQTGKEFLHLSLKEKTLGDLLEQEVFYGEGSTRNRIGRLRIRYRNRAPFPLPPEASLPPLEADELQRIRTLYLRAMPEKKKAAVRLSRGEEAFLAGRGPVRVCVDPAWEPYEWLDPDRNHRGVASDFLRLFAGRIGVRLRIVPSASWSDSLAKVKNGACDMLAMAAPTPSRNAYLRFTTPYFTAPDVIATRSSVPYIEEFSRLSRQPFAIPREYASYETLRERYPRHRFREVDTVEEGLELVARGEVFGLIDLPSSIIKATSSLGLLDLKISSDTGTRRELALAVRKEEPLLLSAFQKAVDSLTPEEKSAIVEKWVNIRYEKGFDYQKLALFLIPPLLALLLIYLWNWRLRTLNRQLRKARLQAETANRAKSLFLAHMSHELRTPLNAVIGFSDLMLKEDELSSESRENMKFIRRNGRHLLSLINDLLDMSRIESGRLQAKSLRFRPVPVLEDALKTLEMRGREKGLTLRMENHVDPDLRVVSDPRLLRQLLLNLLGNGVKYTKRGGVLLRSTTGEGSLLLHVEDTGPGIPPHLLSRIFEPFYQADGERSEGVGLGLTICKRIVETLGGEIRAENLPSGGARFTVRLPAPLAGEERPEEPLLPPLAPEEQAEEPLRALLSPEEAETLRQSCLEGDTAALEALVERLKEERPQTAARLERRIRVFDYGGILKELEA